MPNQTLLDHRWCPPGSHRHHPIPNLGEAGTDTIICPACGQPLLFCGTAARSNNKLGNHYERTYLHVNPNHEERCQP